MLLVPGDGGFDAAGVVAVDGDGVVAKLLSISFEEGIGLGRLMLETFEKIKINYFIFKSCFSSRPVANLIKHP